MRRPSLLALTLTLTLTLTLLSGPLEAQEAGPRVREALDHENPHAALAIADEALAKKPESVDLLALRSEALLQLGKTSDARDELARLACASRVLRKNLASMRAKVEFLVADDAAARRLLADAPRSDRDRTVLPALMQGPFAKEAAIGAVTTGLSGEGHYLVYSDVGADDRAGVREGGLLLETIRKAYLRLFPSDEDATVVHRVYLFAHHDDFAAFAHLLDEGDDLDVDGFYNAEYGVLAIDAGPSRTFSVETRETICHEACHLFLFGHAPGLPTWLDEGLAEYFGPSRITSRGELEVGVVKKPSGVSRGDDQPTPLELIRAGLATGKAVPLAKFLALPEEEFRGEREDANYAQAWSIVHFLLSTPNRRSLLDGYVKLVRTGKTPEEARAATFDGNDLTALEGEWKAYVSRLGQAKRYW